MVKFFYIITILFLIPSCMVYIKGSIATTAISDNFQYKSGIKIAVLPFEEKGKQQTNINIAATDKLSAKLMEMGFIVVERTALESVLEELKLNYISILSDDNRKEVGKLLNADLLVFGTLTYEYEPSSYTSIPMVNFATGQSYGNISEATGSNYILTSGSIRIVDVESGEVKISSYTKSIRGYSITEEIAESIRQKLGLYR